LLGREDQNRPQSESRADPSGRVPPSVSGDTGGGLGALGPLVTALG